MERSRVTRAVFPACATISRGRDGHRVYKRFFAPEGLAEEIGGGRALHAGHWFVMVAAP